MLISSLSHSFSLSVCMWVSLSHYPRWHAVYHADINLLLNLEAVEIIKDMGYVGTPASFQCILHMLNEGTSRTCSRSFDTNQYHDKWTAWFGPTLCVEHLSNTAEETHSEWPLTISLNSPVSGRRNISTPFSRSQLKRGERMDRFLDRTVQLNVVCYC